MPYCIDCKWRTGTEDNPRCAHKAAMYHNLVTGELRQFFCSIERASILPGRCGEKGANFERLGAAVNDDHADTTMFDRMVCERP